MLGAALSSLGGMKQEARRCGAREHGDRHGRRHEYDRDERSCEIDLHMDMVGAARAAS
jgi:hypothetical protein